MIRQRQLSMSQYKKLTLLWILANLIGVAMSAAVSLLLFGRLDITRFAALGHFLQLIWRLALCAVVQGAIVGGLQATVLARAGTHLALRWLKNIVVGMTLGLVAPVLLSLLTHSDRSWDSSVVSGWLFSWVFSGLFCGSAIAPKRNRGKWGLLNACAFLLYVFAVLASFVFLGAAFDRVQNAVALSWMAGFFIFIPLVTVGALINSIIMRQLVRSALLH